MVEETLAGGHGQGCLLLVDVDHMQEVNENFGRQMGDKVLQTVYAMLREHFREGDGIGRLSEDTFGIWIEGLSADQVSGIRRRIAVVNDRLLHGGQDLPTVTLSAGAALGESGESYKEMYRQAQKVLTRVKEGGRCGCEIYTT
jgi:diguanylate cyclase (GGDEF)-like protein